VIDKLRSSAELSGSSISQVVEDTLRAFMCNDTSAAQGDSDGYQDALKAAVKAAFRDAFGG